MPRLVSVIRTGAEGYGKFLLSVPSNKPDVLVEKNMIVTPNKNDVISGRGAHVFNHHGNMNFMVLVKKELSRSTPVLRKRMQAEQIHWNIRNLDPPGRFIRMGTEEENGRGWIELDEKEALLKIQKAIRDYALREKKIRLRRRRV